MEEQSLWQSIRHRLTSISYKTCIKALALLTLWSTLYYLSTRPMPGDVQRSGLHHMPTLTGHQAPAFPIVEPTMKWGFALDTLRVDTGTVVRSQFLADLLTQNGVAYAQVERIVAAGEGVFDFRHFREGKNYAFLTTAQESGPAYFIYEPNPYEYIVFDLRDQPRVERKAYEIDIRERTAVGVVDGSLWNTMISSGLSASLAVKMEDALQWSVDLNHIQPGDGFKLIFDEQYIEGELVGVERVKAAIYQSGDTEHHAIYFDSEKESGYYNLEGRPMNRGFLKSPVKAARISSYYNLNRFHPILKRRRPHFGTDYAAPYGTPILAVGNGVVTRASFTRGNGNFVKIRHDKTYETQYLHMQKFAKGIKPGVQVKQGQVIGYVGSTGLATGPHVCFRFWRNGKQINHTKLEFPPAEPLAVQYMPAFEKTRDRYLAQLQAVPLPTADHAPAPPL